MAVVKVGAATEVELKEKKARVEDALQATRAAVEEGVVPGGGVALLAAARALDELQLDPDMQVGVEIFKRALEEPTRQLVNNAGLEGSVVVQKLRARQKTNPNVGFNVVTETVRRPDRGGDHRPGQGDPLGGGERGVGRRHHPDDRCPGDREAGDVARGCGRRRHAGLRLRSRSSVAMSRQ